MKLRLALSAIALTVAGAQATTAPPSDKAIKLAHDTILIDTHIDVPYRIHDPYEEEIYYE